MALVGDDTDDLNSPPNSPKTNDNEVGSDKSHPSEAVPEVLPNINEMVRHYLCRSPSRPNIIATLDDGRKITIPKHIIDELAVPTRSPSCSSSNSNVISLHTDFWMRRACCDRNLERCVFLISNIKNEHSLFPKRPCYKQLEDAMKDAPEGSG
jgi:hypothetical protein